MNNARNQQRPTKAQRAAQSARDKAANRARGMPQRVPPRSNQGAPRRRQRNRGGGLPRAQGLGGVPPVAGFFAPVAEGTIMKSVKPTFFRDAFAQQRIVHREKVAKLTTPGTGTFTVLKSVALNPGLNDSFPWLANEAAGWESYRFNRLRYIWVPSSSTATAGNIIMAPDYDAADAAPVGETFMSAYTDADEANIWARFASDLEVDLLNGEQRRKFIRTGALASGLDIKTYDSGNFFVASADDAAANSGKLWVEYDVTLFNPQIPSGGFQAAGFLQGATSMATTAPFGTAGVASGTLVLSAAAAVLTVGGVQVGQEFALAHAYNGTSVGECDVTATSGCTRRTELGFGSDSTNATGAYLATFTVTAPNPTVSFAYTGGTTFSSSYAVVTVLAPIPAV